MFNNIKHLKKKLSTQYYKPYIVIYVDDNSMALVTTMPVQLDGDMDCLDIKWEGLDCTLDLTENTTTAAQHIGHNSYWSA
jgi:hypothetical protein